MILTITFISDTHGLHNRITKDLPGGDLLIHAGDLTGRGEPEEIDQFCKWFESLNNYDEKIFIAGNHDWGFQDSPKRTTEIINSYKWINYLQDDLLILGDDYSEAVKIWGSPWQPEFCNWAFNLPRLSDELKEKWSLIPYDTDILITHGPPFGQLDVVTGRSEHLGCELLYQAIQEKKPKIHIFGHIHTGYGHKLHSGIHFVNASTLNERYYYRQKPITVVWNSITNKLSNI